VLRFINQLIAGGLGPRSFRRPALDAAGPCRCRSCWNEKRVVPHLFLPTMRRSRAPDAVPCVNRQTRDAQGRPLWPELA